MAVEVTVPEEFMGTIIGDDSRACRCGPRRVQRYRDRISGPLLDRIDLHIEVPRVAAAELQRAPPSAASAGAAAAAGLSAIVQQSRALQFARQRCCNARLDHAGLDAHCRTEPAAQALVERVSERLGLTARGYHRLLKVARTIADLDGAALLGPAHVSEAASLRPSISCPSEQ